MSVYTGYATAPTAMTTAAMRRARAHPPADRALDRYDANPSASNTSVGSALTRNRRVAQTWSGTALGAVEVQHASRRHHHERTDHAHHASEQQRAYQQRGADDRQRERDRTEIPGHPRQGALEVEPGGVDREVLGALEADDHGSRLRACAGAQA